MLRMTLWSIEKWSVIHQVYKGNKFLGSISAWTDHQFEPYRDIVACCVDSFEIAHFETITSAIKWLDAKRG